MNKKWMVLGGGIILIIGLGVLSVFFKVPEPQPSLIVESVSIIPETKPEIIPEIKSEIIPETISKSIPIKARSYQRDMIRIGRWVWGMEAPVALAGAQIQAESAWNPNARSPYASGLSQFIPSTAKSMAQKYESLGPEPDVFNPKWAIEALYRYDKDIYFGKFVNKVEVKEECDKWAFTLSGYNGGEGWINKDRNLCLQHEGCDPSLWWGNVEKYSGRSQSNWRENREYPRRILKVYQVNYLSWGGFVSCEM
jgi:soluble lytic murein transglycosylase-like protein